MDLGGTELREGYADVGDVSLHYVEVGEGPLVVLLHGFPEFWFGWRLQIGPFADAGFRVVAPDMHGWTYSSRPADVKAYDNDHLTADIRALVQEHGAESAFLVGHDWGGSVAWATAMSNPEIVDRMAILNAAHPRKLSQGLHHPGQLRKSWYFFFFDLPKLPESVVHTNNWHFFRHFLEDTNPEYTAEEIDRYLEAWSQEGAATGMINYYRSSVRQSPKAAEAALRPISAPTLVIWGGRDRYLGPDLAEPEHDDVPNLDRVERLPDASHWVHHDEAERVTQLLIDFSVPPVLARTAKRRRRSHTHKELSTFRGEASWRTRVSVRSDPPATRQRNGVDSAGGASLSGFAALLVFMIQNTEDVTVDFLFWNFTWPLWLLILVSALIGALVWFGVGVLRRHRRRTERRDTPKGLRDTPTE